jgi:hypothetical protein
MAALRVHHPTWLHRLALGADHGLRTILHFSAQHLGANRN